MRLGRMSDRSAAIGLASASSACSAAEQLRLRLGDERPGDGLDHPARRERALRPARAHLQRGEHRLARRIAALERRERHRSTPTMRTISSTMSALPSTSLRHDGIATFTVSPAPATKKPRCFEHALHLGERHVEAGEALHLGDREIDHAILGVRRARDDDLRRRAAAEIEHHLRRLLEPRHHEVRIDAALEAVARVRIDAELAPGLRDVERRPQRRLDQHVGGRPRSSRSPRRP